MNAGTATYSYQLGPTGNRTQATESTGRTLNWSYDGIYRLTNEAIASDPEHANGSVAYGLDPVGNRLTENSSIAGLSSGSFSYNSDDKVSTETYDNNGNTLATGGKNFNYDAENHLTGMSVSGTTVSIVYDAFGNRVAKTVNGVTTKYLVEDDVNPTGDPQVLDELTGSAVNRTYTYGLQRVSQDQVVNNAWQASFYGYDGGGSVRQLTSVAGVVTDTYEYDAFGNGLAKIGTTPNIYLYRGEQYDPDLGVYYLRARYYNPLTGRFLSRDPMEGHAQLPMTLHKYLYAGGDPANRIDPRGLEDMADTALTTEKSVKATTLYANAVACGATLGFAFAQAELVDDIGNGGDWFFAAEGCVTIKYNPAGSSLPWVRSNGQAVLDWVGVAACAWGFIDEVNAINEALEHPNDPIYDEKVDVAAISAFTGCVIPLVASFF
jgi:RHS repeat-associated protein